MQSLEKIIPHVPSKNMQDSIHFMVNVFGFESHNHSKKYAELVSGDHMIGLVEALGEPNQQSIYLRVKDIDVLWLKIKDSFGEVKHKAPFNQAYGMREIHVVIPGTNTLLFIGSLIR